MGHPYKLSRRISKRKSIFILAGLVSIVIFLVSSTLSLFRASIVEILLPLAASVISPDGVVTESGEARLDSFLRLAGMVGILVGFLGVLYSVAGEYFSVNLPKSQDEMELAEERPPRAHLLLAVGFVILGLVIRIPSLGRNFYYDELFSTFTFMQAPTFWDTISTYVLFNNHILYSILGRFSISILGDSEWAARLPALLFGLGSIYLTWELGKRLFNSQIGLMTSFILAIHPTHVLWSNSARGYSGLVFFALLSILAFLRILKEPTPKSLTFFILTSVAGLYIHLYAVWVLIAEYIYLLVLSLANHTKIRKNGILARTESLTTNTFRKLWFSLLIIGLLVLFLYTPVINQLIMNTQRRGQNLFQLSFPLEIFYVFSGNFSILISYVFAILAIVGLYTLWQKSVSQSVFLVSLIVIPLLLVWVLLRPKDLYPRFFASFLLIFILLVVQGLEYLRKLSKSKLSPIAYQVATVVILSISAIISISFIFQSVYFVPEESQYRQGINTLTQKTNPATTLCVFGADAQIFGFYTDESLEVLQTPEDMSDFLNTVDVYRCAYHNIPWNPQMFVDMAEMMEKTSESLEFTRVTLYSSP